MDQKIIELLSQLSGDASQLVAWYLGYLFFSKLVGWVGGVGLAFVLGRVVLRSIDVGMRHGTRQKLLNMNTYAGYKEKEALASAIFHALKLTNEETPLDKE